MQIIIYHLFCARTSWLQSSLAWPDSTSPCKSLSRGVSRVLTGVEDKCNCGNVALKLNFTIMINNQVVRKIKIAVENDVKNWAYISLR